MSKKAHIVVSANIAWGVYKFRLNLIKAMLAEGYVVSAVAAPDEHVAAIEETGCVFRSVLLDRKGRNPLKELACYKALRKAYREIGPAIILQFTIKPNIWGTIAAARERIPVINNITGLGTVFLRKNLSSFIAKGLCKVAFPRATMTFFQNEDDRSLLVSSGYLQRSRTDLVPGSGVDLDRFVPQRSEQNGERPLRFLFAGRLIKDKGVVEYVQAARLIHAHLPNAEFFLVGDVDPSNVSSIDAVDLENWVGEGVVQHFGYADDIRSHIRESDCVVLPSYREGTPRLLLEAAAMGKPVVTTDVPGCRQVVDHEITGLLCKARDRQDLADKMHELIMMSGKRRAAMGAAGRKKMIKEYDEQIVIHRYLCTINGLLKCRSGTAQQQQGNS